MLPENVQNKRNKRSRDNNFFFDPLTGGMPSSTERQQPLVTAASTTPPSQLIQPSPCYHTLFNSNNNNYASASSIIQKVGDVSLIFPLQVFNANNTHSKHVAAELKVNNKELKGEGRGGMTSVCNHSEPKTMDMNLCKIEK